MIRLREFSNSESLVLFSTRLSQPDLSGAHFFGLEKAWKKIAGTEGGKAAQIKIKSTERQIFEKSEINIVLVK